MANLDGVFRREWGPAVAALARWSGDLTIAEDAVQEACAEALRSLAPRRGARQSRRVAGNGRAAIAPGIGYVANPSVPERNWQLWWTISGPVPITPTRIRCATTSCG